MEVALLMLRVRSQQCRTPTSLPSHRRRAADVRRQRMARFHEGF